YSHDNGNTFSDIIRISNPNNDASSISIDADGSSVYIVWHEIINGKHKVLLRYSHDNGNTFSDIIELNKHNAGFPTVEVEGSNVYIAWVERVNNNRNVVLIASNDAGNSFREILRMKDNATLPGLDVDGALVCLSWFGISNNIKLYEACSIDNENFTMHKIAEGRLKTHRISVEGSNVYVAWVEEDGKIKQFNIAASHNAGIDFNEPTNIAVGDINKAGIIASGSNVYALWSELYCIGFNCNNIETNVYARVSYDAGNSFEESFSLG
ncbi:MAG: exo-alpha-sialidase, partial [Candidatus Nitrosothermus koennekii]